MSSAKGRQAATPIEVEAVEPPLPVYQSSDFEKPTNECDVIMKGGVTSGVVYPYALLEIARTYRFRSLGGTSAGAIAASFAAAAEYARSVRNDPSGFVRLQAYCNCLPDILPRLFQPEQQFSGLVRVLKRFHQGGVNALLVPLLGWSAFVGIAAGVGLWWLLGRMSQAPTFGSLAAVLCGFLLSICWALMLSYLQFWRPLVRAKKRLAEDGFGACTGRTESDSAQPGLTDWLHAALQDIAFGNPNHPDPLTFADLEQRTLQAAAKPIELRMITTNLSMGRPHTLPQLGIQAGFKPSVWERYFPEPVLAYLKRQSGTWHDQPGVLRVPQGADLPVICAVRMSLSFPILFKAVPILTLDHEAKAIEEALGGAEVDEASVASVWLTDGGLSSNFPVHLFDAPLPGRPTFAIGLDALPSGAEGAAQRAYLPRSSAEGIGLPVKSIGSLVDFGWAILSAAKDWQDQLASGITGQRERIARVFLTGEEGGLNLAMDAATTTKLMGYGLQAGELFVRTFDFEEHRWRRVLATYKNGGEWLDDLTAEWGRGTAEWYRSYAPVAVSYRLPLRDQRLIARQLDQVSAARQNSDRVLNSNRKFPRRTGQLRAVPQF